MESTPVERAGQDRIPSDPDGAFPTAGYTDEYDTPAEVDATFRTQRKIAFGYFAVFLIITLAVPALTLVLDWWSEGRVIGAMSPNFIMAAAGLYVFFFIVAVAAATLSSAVEDRMLGGPDEPPLPADPEFPEFEADASITEPTHPPARAGPFPEDRLP